MESRKQCDHESAKEEGGAFATIFTLLVFLLSLVFFDLTLTAEC